MKTPIQQAIYKASLYANDCRPQTRERGIALAIISELTALLPNEREVIEEAYEAGMEDERRFNKGYMFEADKFVYFTTKFNDNGTDAKG